MRELYQVSMINDIQCLQCTKVNTCSQHPHCASVPSPCHQETSLSCYNSISKFIHMCCDEVYVYCGKQFHLILNTRIKSQGIDLGSRYKFQYLRPKIFCLASNATLAATEIM